MALRRFLALVAAFMLVVLVLAAWSLPDNGDFQAENGSWNGLSGLDRVFEYRALASLADLPEDPEGSCLIIIPYLDFAPAELERVGRYVAGGGDIILADDYGYGNRLLAYLGLETRFSGSALLDPLVNYKNERFPRIARLEPGALTDGIEGLVFNHATALVNVEPENVLARSSPFSFLDDDGSGARGPDETSGPLPVIASQQIGRSRVVLVSDPSVFINGMALMEGNARFIANIAADSTALYFDGSHLDTSELGRTKGWLKAARGALASPAGTVLLVSVAVITALLPVWRRRENPSHATLFQNLLSNILKRRPG